jgi:hypothetical protein
MEKTFVRGLDMSSTRRGTIECLHLLPEARNCGKARLVEDRVEHLPVSRAMPIALEVAEVVPQAVALGVAVDPDLGQGALDEGPEHG